MALYFVHNLFKWKCIAWLLDSSGFNYDASQNTSFVHQQQPQCFIASCFCVLHIFYATCVEHLVCENLWYSVSSWLGIASDFVMEYWNQSKDKISFLKELELKLASSIHIYCCCLHQAGKVWWRAWVTFFWWWLTVEFLCWVLLLSVSCDAGERSVIEVYTCDWWKRGTGPIGQHKKRC